MGARQKINQAHVNGAIVLAVVAGGLLQSWTVFWITFGLAAASAWYDGGIRSGPGHRK